MSRSRFANVVMGNAWVLWTWLAAVALVHTVHYGTGLGQPSLGLALSSCALPAVIVAATPVRSRRWAALGIVTALAVLAFANALYHRFFQDYIPLALLGQVGQAWSVRGYGSGLVRASDAVTPLAVVLATAVAAWKSVAPSRALAARSQYAFPSIIALLGCVPALVFAWVVAPGAADTATGGFLYADLVDARRAVGERMMSGNPPADDFARVVAFTVDRRSPRPSPDAWFGSAAGSSVLMIQVEALNKWTLDADIGGRPVLPFLRSLVDRGLYFTDLYDGVHEGRSSDADHMVMASQQPLERDAVSMTRPNLDVVALPHLLAEAGYTTFSAHAHNAGFWNSGIRHRQYGFQKSVFSPELGGGENLGLGLLDRDFMRGVEPMLEDLGRPFLAWLITLTMHGPHREIPASFQPFPLGPLQDTPLGNYLLKARHTDDAVRDLVAALDSAGVLAHTTLVIYGDHIESYEFDMQEVRRIAGAGDLPQDEARLFLDRMPLLIVPPGGVTPVRVATPGTLIDVAPTVLHLLGIASPRSFVGRSLLPEGDGLAAQVSGEVVADDLMWTGSGCYARPSGERRASSDCDALRAQAREQLEVSWLITRYDLSRELVGRPTH